MSTVQERLQLQPHPEGGFYREIYRSKQSVNVNAGQRSACTAIYFYLGETDISHLHRLKHDELWSWHEGGSATIHMIHPDGRHEQHQLGPNGDYTVVIPAGCWFGATVTGSHVLLTAIVAPGFDFADFELGDQNTLLEQFPEHVAIIHELT